LDEPIGDQGMMRQAPDIHDAIQSLSPGAQYVIPDPDDLDMIVWSDEIPPPAEGEALVGPVEPVDPIGYKPSADEITAELDRLIAIYQSQEYMRERQLAYPPIGDQLDALFHAGVFPEDMAAQLQAVKDQHPKDG